MKTPARLLLIGAMTALSACSGGESDPSHFVVQDSAGIPFVTNLIAGGWSKEEAPELIDEIRIGTVEGDENYLFGMVSSLDVDNDGNIYVLDFQAREVKAFDENGQFLRRVGRPGSGPGELGMSLSMFVQGDSVGVMDAGNRRVQWFGPDGGHAGSFPVQTGSTSAQRLLHSGNLILQHRAMSGASIEEALLPTDLLLLYNSAGEVVDTILTLPPNETVRIEDGSKIVPLVLGATAVWGVSENRILTARSTEMRIQIHSSDGSLSRVFTLDAPQHPVSSERLEQLRGSMENLARTLRNVPGVSVGDVEVNPFYPMIATIFAGPAETIWVAQPVPDEEGNLSGGTWHVFDGEGGYRGALDLGNFQPMRTVEDRIYGTMTDDLGVQYVVRKRVSGL